MRTRRNFIKDTAILSAGIAITGGCSKASAESMSPFTKSERDCLIAMAEQFIPRDEKYGGATDAGVIFYIENWVTKYYPETLESYKAGVASVQKSSMRLYKKEFQELDTKMQIEFLKKMENSKLDKSDWENQNQKNFFNNVLTNTMQGFYGPPRHGGNKNYMSYKMLKLDMPLVIGQNRYGRKG